MKWLTLASIVTLALATIACGNPLSTAEETQTAVAGAVIGTSTPEGSTVEATATGSGPISPPPVTTFAPATPAFVTPVAAGSADSRSDCPSQTESFVDVAGVLSLCAPPDIVAVSDVDANGAPGITVGSDLAGIKAPGVPRVAVAAAITRTANFATPLADTCRAAFPGGVEVDIQIGSLAATGCQALTEENSPDGPLGELHLSAQLPPASDGSARFLDIFVSWRTQSEGAEALARQIASSLRVAS